MTEWYQVYIDRIKEKSTIGKNGVCVIWMWGSKRVIGSMKYGEMKAKIPGEVSKKYSVHRLQYILHNLDTLHPKGDISHLCHNSLCINMDHLSLEPREINNNRQGCLSRGSCKMHEGYRDCMVHLYMGNAQGRLVYKNVMHPTYPTPSFKP